MGTIRVEAPARLHLGMLAVAGDGERRFGGLGVSVSGPAVVLEARPADELSAEGADAERALTFAQRCREARARVSTVVVGGGAGREFLGLNRARHAVLEASILASRARWLAADDIRAELRRLQVLVDKTAGPREREAMAYVRAVLGDP